MSAFFFSIAIILYGICQWLASNGRPQGTPLYELRFQAAGDTEHTLQATVDWIATQNFLHLSQGTHPSMLVAEQKQGLLTFGSFFKFRIDPVGEEQSVCVSFYPKFISTTYEHPLIAEDYTRFVKGVLAQSHS